jgi:hypothetical protein
VAWWPGSAFWAFYGAGFGAENLAQIAAFGGAYMSVILIEPVLDLGMLAVAKTLRSMENSKCSTPGCITPQPDRRTGIRPRPEYPTQSGAQADCARNTALTPTPRPHLHKLQIFGFST